MYAGTPGSACSRTGKCTCDKRHRGPCQGLSAQALSSSHIKFMSQNKDKQRQRGAPMLLISFSGPVNAQYSFLGRNNVHTLIPSQFRLQS